MISSVFCCSGCEFEGNKEEVKDHEKVCGYRGLLIPTGNDLDVRVRNAFVVISNYILSHAEAYYVM